MADAKTMQLSFNMPTAGNNWWRTVDNIKVEGSDIDRESPVAGLDPDGSNKAETRPPPLCQLSSAGYTSGPLRPQRHLRAIGGAFDLAGEFSGSWRSGLDGRSADLARDFPVAVGQDRMNRLAGYPVHLQ